MVFDGIANIVGALLNAIVGYNLGLLEKAAPALAAWVQAIFGAMSVSGDGNALVLLAIAGLAFGFIACLVEIFVFGKLRRIE